MTVNYIHTNIYLVRLREKQINKKQRMNIFTAAYLGIDLFIFLIQVDTILIMVFVNNTGILGSSGNFTLIYIYRVTLYSISQQNTQSG